MSEQAFSCRHCGYDLLLLFNRQLVCVRCGAAAKPASMATGGSTRREEAVDQLPTPKQRRLGPAVPYRHRGHNAPLCRPEP